MDSKKREATIKELGSHWAKLAKTLRSTRKDQNKIIQEADVSDSTKKTWRKSSKNQYEVALKLILRLAKKRRPPKTS